MTVIDRVNCTVIVCAKNSETTLDKCLSHILANNPKDLYVVDGNSTDATRLIAENRGVRVYNGLNRGLTADRQLGIEKSHTEYTFFVDSDHFVPENFLVLMLDVIQRNRATLVQSYLKIDNPTGLLNRGENTYYELFHNTQSRKVFPGLAPTVFETKELRMSGKVPIYAGEDSTIDDTSWTTRALDLGLLLLKSEPVVSQVHEPDLTSYYKKFKWYGLGDGEFCRDFHHLRSRHLFHLFIRYPIIYSAYALSQKRVHVVPFLILQGLTRGGWAVLGMIRKNSSVKRKPTSVTSDGTHEPHKLLGVKDQDTNNRKRVE